MEQVIPEVGKFIANYPGFTLCAAAHLGIVVNRFARAGFINNQRYNKISKVTEHFISRGTFPLFYGEGLQMLGEPEAFAQSAAVPLSIAHSLLWEGFGAIVDRTIRWKNILADFSGILAYSLISSFR